MARIFSFSYQSHHVKDRSGRSLLNVVARWQPMFSSHLRSRSGTMPALRRNKAGKPSRGGCLHKRTRKAAQPPPWGLRTDRCICYRFNRCDWSLKENGIIMKMFYLLSIVLMLLYSVILFYICLQRSGCYL